MVRHGIDVLLNEGKEFFVFVCLADSPKDQECKRAVGKVLGRERRVESNNTFSFDGYNIANRLD